ncbi:MAG: shikimate dehydrogenase [Gammaproteobacteria bacterium]|nr:shikimate dehydrogenase [Gammaproteobacteria bacterium]
MMQLNSQTTLNMVIGYPLSHTQSPLLHGHLYQRLNLNAVLLAFSHETVEPLVQTIKTLAVGLTAVTLPFKAQIFPYLDDRSEAGQAMAAVNTVIYRNGKLHGHNTDVDGIAYALRTVELADKRVLIIGAGGAARAAGYLMQRQQAKIFWLNRTRERAEQLAAMFSGEVIDSHQIEQLPIDVIINTTSLGMSPNIEQSPLSDYSFNSQQVVFDMVYNPVDTRLLLSAQKSGAQTISGVEMFIGQGIRQIELWRDIAIEDEQLINEVRELLLAQQKNLREKLS